MRVAGAKTAVVFSENAAFTKWVIFVADGVELTNYHSGMADGALAACSDNSIDVLKTFQLPRVSTYTTDNTAAIKNMTEQIRDLNPGKIVFVNVLLVLSETDIVIGGTYDLACQQFVNISKEINWAPNAIILSVCLGSIKQYQAALGQDGRWALRRTNEKQL